jgi:hypothetical protein
MDYENLWLQKLSLYFAFLIDDCHWITDVNLPASASWQHRDSKGWFLLAYHPSQRC